jgi:hypothetical protein
MCYQQLCFGSEWESALGRHSSDSYLIPRLKFRDYHGRSNVENTSGANLFLVTHRSALSFCLRLPLLGSSTLNDEAVAILALGASRSFLGIEGLKVEKRDSPAVLPLPLEKRTPGLSSKKTLSKCQGEVQTPDINYQTQLLYLVELQIGTPPQMTCIQLDTGSSELIVETHFTLLYGKSTKPVHQLRILYGHLLRYIETFN